MPTIVAKGPNAVCYRTEKKSWEHCAQGITRVSAANMSERARSSSSKGEEMGKEYIVRRLTPVECARLQGFPDKWGEIDHKEDFTEEEYKFWLDVRTTYAKINGKQVKAWTKPQMLTWYNKLHTDSAEYKMWGNGIALPNALYVIEGIEESGKKRGL